MAPMLDRERVARAQAVVIGAVVLFGFAVALLGILQLQVVPAQVQGDEIAHSELVGDELATVGSTNWEAATRGELGTTEVTTGLNYRHRFLLLTPPPARGRLTVEPLGSVGISNVVSLDGTDVTGTLGPFETSALTYTPAYSRYDTAPTTTLEPHVVYDRFEDGAEVVEGEWSFIDDTRITLVTLTGSVSSEGRLTETVRVVPVSAPSTVVPVTNTAGGPVTLSIPTGLSNESWAEILEPAYASNGGHVLSHSVADGVLTVVLESGVEYDLRLARVSVGTDAAPTKEPATQVVTVSGGDRTVPPGGTQVVTVEARDRFNNPVTGVEVRADASGANATVESTSRLTTDPAVGTTDERGQASFVVTADGTTMADTATLTFDVPEVEVDEGDGLTLSPKPTATPEPGATATPTFTPTVTATPTPVPTLSPSPTPTATPVPGPSVKITEIAVDRAGKSGNVKGVSVTFVPEDPDGNLQNATIEIYVAGGLEATKPNVDLVGNEGQAKTVTVDFNKKPSGDVVVRVVVTDAAGNPAEDQKNEP